MRLLFVSLGLLLLVVVLNTWAVDAMGHVDGIPRSPVVPRGKALDLQAIGGGQGLSSVLIAGISEPSGIWVGDRRFDAPNGLIAVVIDRQRRILSNQVIDPRTTPRAELLWDRFLQDVPDPGILVIASNGLWWPLDSTTENTWSTAFTDLGINPISLTGPSGLALVLERRSGSWIVVGERIGRSQSARMDLRVPASWPEVAIPQIGSLAQTEIPLAIQTPTILPLDGLGGLGGYSVSSIGMTLSGWNMHPPFDKFLVTHPDGMNRMGWNVHLGAKPQFSAWVRHDGIPVGSDGGIFQVRINDEIVCSQFVGPNPAVPISTPPESIPILVDLSAWANQVVNLTIHTLPHRGTGADWMHWIGMSVTEKGEGKVSATTPARLRFVGHAYPMIGDDKTRREYLGVKGDQLLTDTSRFHHRVALERDPSAFASWCNAISKNPVARVVWLGDLAYSPDSVEIDVLGRMLKQISGPHVWVPGNHDPDLLSSASFLGNLKHWGRGAELIRGVRVTYVDTVTPTDGEVVDVSDATCRPNQVWIDRTVARITQDGSSRNQIILMHHAPWLTITGTANVAHDQASNWWITQVHPKLVSHAQATGQHLWVVAGDAGDHVAAAGTELNGISYLLTGLPRSDSQVPMSWLEVSWEKTELLQWEIHTWDFERGVTVEKVTFPFRK